MSYPTDEEFAAARQGPSQPRRAFPTSQLEFAQAKVRARFPASACIPVSIQESCPPRVSSWQVRDFANGPDPLGDALGSVGSTETQAWENAAETMRVLL